MYIYSSQSLTENDSKLEQYDRSHFDSLHGMSWWVMLFVLLVGDII